MKAKLIVNTFIGHVSGLAIHMYAVYSCQLHVYAHSDY